MRALIRAGSDLNATDEGGNTPLAYTAHLYKETHEEIAIMLLDAGADPNILVANYSGQRSSMLHYAPSEKVVRALLAHGAQVNIKDSYGGTPLDHVVNEKIRAILIQAGGK